MHDSTPSFRSPTLRSVLMGADVLPLMADSVICTDEDGRILVFNQAAERSFGYAAHEAIGEYVEMLLPQRHRAQHANQVRGFAEGGGASNRIMGYQREVVSRRKNGEEFIAEATISRESVDGKTILTVVHRDITERKAFEQQRDTIAQELDHRIRNVLSVVSSLVSLSARSAKSVGEFEHSLQERLQGLALTQTFLRKGAQSSMSLRDLLVAELAHYNSPDGRRTIINGAPITLCPSAVQPLALAFHELATNSAKYGALSNLHGCVTVTSEFLTDGDRHLVAIEWRETGGPPVKSPGRKGFGTTLIEQVIKRVFRADVAFDYRSEGLVCRMTLQRAKVEEGFEA